MRQLQGLPPSSMEKIEQIHLGHLKLQLEEIELERQQLDQVNLKDIIQIELKRLEHQKQILEEE